MSIEDDVKNTKIEDEFECDSQFDETEVRIKGEEYLSEFLDKLKSIEAIVLVDDARKIGREEMDEIREWVKTQKGE